MLPRQKVREIYFCLTWSYIFLISLYFGGRRKKKTQKSINFSRLDTHVVISELFVKVINTSILFLNRRDNGIIKNNFRRRQEKGNEINKTE